MLKLTSPDSKSLQFRVAQFSNHSLTYLNDQYLATNHGKLKLEEKTTPFHRPLAKRSILRRFCGGLKGHRSREGKPHLLRTPVSLRHIIHSQPISLISEVPTALKFGESL